MSLQDGKLLEAKLSIVKRGWLRTDPQLSVQQRGSLKDGWSLDSRYSLEVIDFMECLADHAYYYALAHFVFPDLDRAFRLSAVNPSIGTAHGRVIG